MKIFTNANIYSQDGEKPSAFVVEDGSFIALGSDTEILQSFAGHGKITNLGGRTVWPGLIDAHLHLQQLAATHAMIDCETETIEDCLERVKNRSDQLPANAWVRGHGWNQNRWENGYGDADQLESVCGGRPAYLTAKSLHAAWVNRTALKMLGIIDNITDKFENIFQVDQDGKPTGIIFELEGMAAVENIIPQPTRQETSAQILTIIPELWRLGLVGVHDFDGLSCWEALQELHHEHNLGIRVRKNIPFDHIDDFIQSGFQTNSGDDWLNIGNLKLFSDGALGPQTAAMSLPYINTDLSGNLALTQEEIFQIGVKSSQHRIALSIHAIGDLANHLTLNALENLRKYETDNNLPHLPHRIEHVQIIQPEDIARFAKLDIIASVQPVHAPSDMLIADKYLGERAAWAYNFKSLIESGAKVVFGSDAPVEPVNPFGGIHAAVTRRRIDGSPGEQGWYPHQRISLQQALSGFSAAPALITERTAKLGQIKNGYKADFIILEKDPFTMDKDQLHRIEPAATFIDGNCVYRDNALSIDFS